ncbi:MAG: hypothetical protein DRR16_10670 [Candidatus Parabeggiatoa sp. nov. 3]|nr:MAG: hypothetical protein DRR00_08370 [Gammaproteobacteria bacterium]RKZ66725.1 MAG: hypothetical protein DRQ99_08795 [Gammaproteobacteria bacterium]RKZ86041.1 MAG: hypothetical protein DRR16_10670 [Gammaproteobacteria bacterium]
MQTGSHLFFLSQKINRITIISFSVFLVIFLWIGALAAKFSTHTDADYLLGNRSFGKYVIGLSAGATANSGWIMIGAVGAAYSQGFSAFLLIIAYFLGDITFWMLFPERINKMSIERNSQTVPELIGSAIEKPQGKRTITLIAALLTVVFIGAYTAAQFAAAGKTLEVFFGLKPELGALIAVVAILIYSVTGGIRASIWTDVVQSVVVIFVSFGLLTVVIIAGGGISNIITALNQIDPQLTQITAGFTNWTLLAFMVGFFFWGFGFDMSQPQMLVRLLASKNPKEARQARWVYLSYVYSTWTAMVLFGVICRVLIPEIDDPEKVLPFYAMQNFDPWLVGIILAGIFSVIASTADSQILVCSSALAKDISPTWYQKMSQKYGMRYQQFITVLVGVLAFIATISISSTVFALVLFAVGALTSSLGPAMLITLLKRRTHYLALTITMLVGLITAIVWQILGYHEIIFEGFPGFIIALLVHELLMVSLFAKQR